jgi:cyclic pyranopterin phosphate synthase
MYHEDCSPLCHPGQESGEMRPASLCDRHGRSIRYLRLAITDRCNLRCRYCMPEKGIVPVSHGETLSYEEMTRLVKLLLPLGIDKVRITGGEPFARRGCLHFLRSLKELGVPKLHLTTNGVETWRYLDELRSLGLSGLNLSLDSLNRRRFAAITRRDRLGEALNTFSGALSAGIPLKINSVALPDTSDEEIEELAGLARDHAITVRFIEPMPFSGANRQLAINSETLAARLARLFPGAARAVPGGVAEVFTPPGFTGKIGYIAGHSRIFCQRCDKIRLTATGMLKNCLYDNGVLDLRRFLRDGASDLEIVAAIRETISQRHLDGHLTEMRCPRSTQPSMATVGG